MLKMNFSLEQMKTKIKRNFLIFLVLGLIIILSFSGILISLELKIRNKRVFSIIDERTQDIIICTYYTGSIDYGVIVLQGFGSDQISIKSIITEFIIEGFHVFSYDYSGHGRSSGFIDFNNTGTDKLALQLRQMKEEFKLVSGLNDSQIVFVGQSYGARIALQEQTFDNLTIAGMILIGVQVNLDVSNKADVFTGVSDLDLEWINNLGLDNPKTNISIMTGTWDEVLPPSGAILLYEKLTNENYADIGSYFPGTNKNSREVLFFNGIVHNYEVYSTRIVKEAKVRVANFLGLNSLEFKNSSLTVLRTASWLLTISGFYICFYSLSKLLSNNKNEHQERKRNFEYNIQNTKRYSYGKIASFLISIPMMVLIALFFLIFGVDLPLLAITYTSFFFAIGIVDLILYWKDHMWGVEGTWYRSEKLGKLDKELLKNISLVLGVSFIIIIVLSFILQTGLWTLFPARKIPWLVLLTPFCFFGVYMQIKQVRMISNQEKRKKINLLAHFGVIVGLILMVILLAAVFGFVGIIVGLFEIGLTFGYITLLGIFINKISKNDLLTAIVLTVVLLYLVIPQSVVFRNPLY